MTGTKSSIKKPSGVDLRVDLGGFVLPTPVMVASGCFHYGREFEQFFNLNQLGAVIVKSVSPVAWPGHPPPRATETPSGMLNCIGLQNPGVDAFCERDLPWLVKQKVPVIASIVGNTAEEFVRVAERLRGAEGIVAIEANISCPNLEDRSRMFSAREESTVAVIRGVKRVATQPVFAKLSPDVVDIASIAVAAVESGANGLSIMNTILGLAVDAETYKPRLSATTGGLSGPAIKPIALRCVWQVFNALPDIPIIGQGGIRTGIDAAEFIIAGASAVAVGTANFVDPQAALRVTEQLASFMERKGIEDVASMRGRLIKQ